MVGHGSERGFHDGSDRPHYLPDKSGFDFDFHGYQASHLRFYHAPVAGDHALIQKHAAHHWEVVFIHSAEYHWHENC
jgi:hypothetical protein